jgi:hypothetical protein
MLDPNNPGPQHPGAIQVSVPTAGVENRSDDEENEIGEAEVQPAAGPSGSAHTVTARQVLRLMVTGNVTLARTRSKSFLKYSQFLSQLFFL